MTDKKFSPSPEQQAFFDWIDFGRGSCVLEAVAGAGKTTALVEGVRRMSGSVFIGAFNKKIADEIKGRIMKADIPNNRVFVSTMHAAGLSAWRRRFPNVVVDEHKVRDIVDGMLRRVPGMTEMASNAVCALVGYAKQAGFGVLVQRDDHHRWHDLIDHYDVDCYGLDEDVVRWSIQALKDSAELDTIKIDFNDMLLSPLLHGARFFKNDWVLIDEAQDTNAVRRAMALAMMGPGSRLVAVGDPHQAIYGFTGADNDALELISKAVNAKRLPLSVSWRCPQAVVRTAQQYVHHIQAAPTADEGEVTACDMKLAMEQAAPGDAMLCRFNAPLLQTAYRFIAAGKPCRVEGRDIGKGLLALINKYKTNSIDIMVEKLEAHVEAKKQKLIAKRANNQAQALEDRFETILVMCQRLYETKQNPTVADLRMEIETMFQDNVGSNMLVMSSIHKSKGREWPTVWWMQTGPSPYARQQWELEQETNLLYVAATRAMKRLVRVDL